MPVCAPCAAGPLEAVCCAPAHTRARALLPAPLARARSYDGGVVHAVGAAHSGAVTHVAVSPDGSRIVSVGAEGGVFVWQSMGPPAAAE